MCLFSKALFIIHNGLIICFRITLSVKYISKTISVSDGTLVKVIGEVLKTFQTTNFCQDMVECNLDPVTQVWNLKSLLFAQFNSLKAQIFPSFSFNSLFLFK